MNTELIKKLKELNYEQRMEYIKKYFEALDKVVEGKTDKELIPIVKSLSQSGKDVEILTLFIVSLIPKEIQDQALPLLPLITSLMISQGINAVMSLLNAYGIDAEKLQKIGMFIKRL